MGAGSLIYQMTRQGARTTGHGTRAPYKNPAIVSQNGRGLQNTDLNMNVIYQLNEQGQLSTTTFDCVKEHESRGRAEQRAGSLIYQMTQLSSNELPCSGPGPRVLGAGPRSTGSKIAM